MHVNKMCIYYALKTAITGELVSFDTDTDKLLLPLSINTVWIFTVFFLKHNSIMRILQYK